MWRRCLRMKNEAEIRNEPGEYRIWAKYDETGDFTVWGESSHPITLTVRVEDVWDRLPSSCRRYAYTVTVRRDGHDVPLAVLQNVAPDARIFLDFEKRFEMVFA